MNPIRLLVSTRNAHKLREISKILGEEFSLLDLSSLPTLGQVEETGATFDENAVIKALAASQLHDGWVIADDSGLEVDALGGAPGVLSARFAGEPSDDAANTRLLLEKLRAVPATQRTARFRCVIALARAGRHLATFEGKIEGHILEACAGSGGFGYDPVFQPEGFDRTFGELPEAVKNSISHRSEALRQLRGWKGWLP